MSASFRVVVENGWLRPLDPIDLVEGQEAEVMVVTDSDPIVSALEGQLELFPGDEPRQDRVR